MKLDMHGTAPTSDELERIAGTVTADRIGLVEFSPATDHAWPQSLGELIETQHPDVPIWVNQLSPAVRIDWGVPADAATLLAELGVRFGAGPATLPEIREAFAPLDFRAFSYLVRTKRISLNGDVYRLAQP